MDKERLEITLAGRSLATFRDERDLMDTAAARVSELDAMARRAASEAVRCALAAGAILLAVKGRLPHGAFLLWLSQNCGSVSERTAQKYMALAERTQAEAEALPTDDGPKALIGDRSLTDLYRDYGIVRREASAKWGGAREGAGRPAKDPAAEVAAAAGDPDLNWAEVSGYLKGIREFAVEEDGFGTLADDDLESAVVILTEAAERARALLAARRENGGSAEAVSRIRAELAPDVPCVRADKDGYCTGPCEGSICARCSEYRPVGRGL